MFDGTCESVEGKSCSKYLQHDIFIFYNIRLSTFELVVAEERGRMRTKPMKNVRLSVLQWNLHPYRKKMYLLPIYYLLTYINKFRTRLTTTTEDYDVGQLHLKENVFHMKMQKS